MIEKVSPKIWVKNIKKQTQQLFRFMPDSRLWIIDTYYAYTYRVLPTTTDSAPELATSLNAQSLS